MIVEKVVSVYANVDYAGCFYKVYPDGKIYVWSVSDDNVEGWWSPYDDCEDDFYLIQEAGLNVLKD